MNASMETKPTSNAVSGTSAKKSLAAAIKAEIAVYEATGVRGRCLQLVYAYLLSIPPTSVEAERAFSAAGLLCTKVRSRLSDKTLDTMCLLRAFYRKPDNVDDLK